MEELIDLEQRKAFIDDLRYIGGKGYNIRVPSGEPKNVWVDENIRPVYDCFIDSVRSSMHYRTNDSFRDDFENWNDLYKDSLWFFSPKDVFGSAVYILAKHDLIQ